MQAVWTDIDSQQYRGNRSCPVNEDAAGSVEGRSLRYRGLLELGKGAWSTQTADVHHRRREGKVPGPLADIVDDIGEWRKGL